MSNDIFISLFSLLIFFMLLAQLLLFFKFIYQNQRSNAMQNISQIILACAFYMIVFMIQDVKFTDRINSFTYHYNNNIELMKHVQALREIYSFYCLLLLVFIFSVTMVNTFSITHTSQEKENTDPLSKPLLPNPH